jgi:hypothetical protein
MNMTKVKRIKRSLAAAAAFLAVCSVAPAQTKSATVATGDDAAPKYEIGIFGGSQWWGVNSSGKNNADQLRSGGIGGVRFTYDLAKHWGLEATWDIYAVNNLRLFTPLTNVVSTVNFGARNTQVQGGPVYYFQPRDSKFRFFLTIGPEYISFWPTKDAKGFAQSPAYAAYNAPYLGGKDGAALFYGGGFKYNFTPHFGMRIDMRGIFAKNPDFNLPAFGATNTSVYIPTKQTINGLQALLGIEYRFGAHVVTPPPPPPPPAPVIKDMSVTLSADKSDVCPGDPVRVSLTTNAGSGAAYQWTINGSAASGDTSLTFDTNGKSAGTYSIAATVRAAGFNNGSGSTTVNVREYRTPTGSVSASPATISMSGTSSISSSFRGQCGDPIKAATYTASEGSISGDTFNPNGVRFDPNNTAAQSKAVTITATAVDAKGGRGTATTTVTVTKPANPQFVRLPDIIFAPGSARVNNAGKRVLLEQLKTYLDRDPTGQVVFVGHFVDKEPKPRKGETLDELRALNAAAVISAGKAICLGFAPSQIMLGYTGANQNGVEFQPFFDAGSKERAGSIVKETDTNSKYRRVEVYFVPTGAKIPSTATNLKDAGSLGVASLGCPK